MKLTQKDKRKIMSEKLDYEKSDMFLHCAKCLDEKPDNQSPQMYASFEFARHPFTYPDGTEAGILVLWCKRHKKQVWDSRHLTHLF